MVNKKKPVLTKEQEEKVEIERQITAHEKEEEKKAEVIEPWEHVRIALQEAMSMYAKAYNRNDSVKKIDFQIEHDLYRLKKPEKMGNGTIVAKGVVRIILAVHHKITDITKTALLSNSVFGFQDEAEAETNEWKLKCYTGVLKDFIGYTHMVADAKLRTDEGKTKSKIITLGEA